MRPFWPINGQYVRIPESGMSGAFWCEKSNAAAASARRFYNIGITMIKNFLNYVCTRKYLSFGCLLRNYQMEKHLCAQAMQFEQLEQFGQFEQLEQLEQFGQFGQLEQFEQLEQLEQLEQFGQFDQFDQLKQCKPHNLISNGPLAHKPHKPLHLLVLQLGCRCFVLIKINVIQSSR